MEAICKHLLSHFLPYITLENGWNSEEGRREKANFERKGGVGELPLSGVDLSSRVSLMANDIVVIKSAMLFDFSSFHCKWRSIGIE